MSVVDEMVGMIVLIWWLWWVSVYGLFCLRLVIMGVGFWCSLLMEIDFIVLEYKGIVDCCLFCFWWVCCDC